MIQTPTKSFEEDRCFETDLVPSLGVTAGLRSGGVFQSTRPVDDDSLSFCRGVQSMFIHWGKGSERAVNVMGCPLYVLRL